MKRTGVSFALMLCLGFFIAAPLATSALTQQAPVGYLETPTQHGYVWGWATDPDTPQQPVTISFYLDGAIGAGTLVGTTTADIPRADVNKAGWPGDHGFVWTIPHRYEDGAPHTLYVYATDTTTGTSTQLTFSPKSFSIPNTMLYLDTPVMRVGIDTAMGGIITDLVVGGIDYIKGSGGVGRSIQIAVYDANEPPTYPMTPVYNPTQGGDAWDHGSPVIAQSQSTSTIYVKTKLLQWYPEKYGGGATQPVPSDVMLEEWISTVPGVDAAVKVHYEVTGLGPTSHLIMQQQSPAVFVAPSLTRLVHYANTSPWTYGAVSNDAVINTGSPNYYNPEHWASLVDGTGFGITLYQPGAYPYVVDSIDPTIPISPLMQMSAPYAIEANKTIKGDFYIIAGNYVDARNVVYFLHATQPAAPDTLPPFGYIDQPAKNAAVTGMYSVVGWLFDNTAVKQVEVFVDGTSVGLATYGSSRPDVLSLFPNAPLNIGFDKTIDTTRYTNGSHTIKIVATDPAGNAFTYEVPVTIANASAVPARPACVPDWSCTAWNECSASATQTRVCTDRNACGTAAGKPVESQSCSVPHSGEGGGGVNAAPKFSPPQSAPAPQPAPPALDRRTLIAQLLAKILELNQKIIALGGTPIVIPPLLRQGYEGQAGISQTTSCTISRTLALGMRGGDVKCLQRFLITQNLLAPDSASGYFGPLTRAAVIALQTSRGLEPVGFVGKLTRAIINGANAAPTLAPAPALPVPPAPQQPQPPVTPPPSSGGAPSPVIPLPPPPDTTPSSISYWHTSGKSFVSPQNAVVLPQGMNLDIGWMKYDLSRSDHKSALLQWLTDAQDLGSRVIRVFPDAPSGGDIEQNGIGQYDQKWFENLDFVLDFARQHDMYVEIVLTPGYTQTYAGQTIKQSGFFSSPAVRQALKNRFTAIAGRYKNDPVIFSWEIMNEPAFWVSATSGAPSFPPQTYSDFATEMSAYLRQTIGVKQMITDGAAVDDIIRSGIPSKYPAFMTDLDYFVKHAYNLPPATVQTLVPWEDGLVAGAGVQKPWIFEEFGHTNDSMRVDYATTDKATDPQNATYFDAVLSFIQASNKGALLWGVYCPDIFCISRRFVPETAKVVTKWFIGLGVVDVTAPVVALTAPAASSTVSGVITVSATASDNVGVAGVQFKLDGANLGAEDMTAPYSISWNTASASNGTHTITAVARDMVGNRATSTMSVTVSNTVSPYTFGAKGDCIADDTVPLRKFFAVGGTLAAGCYKTTDTVTVPSGVSVIGVGQQSSIQLKLPAGSEARPVLYVVDIVNNKESPLTKNITLKNFAVDGGNVARNLVKPTKYGNSKTFNWIYGDGILISSSHTVVDRVWVSNVWDNGISASQYDPSTNEFRYGGPKDIKITNIVCRNNGHQNLPDADTTNPRGACVNDLSARDFHLSDSTDDGSGVGFTVDFWGGAEGTFDNLTAKNNHLTGYYIGAPYHLTNLRAENSGPLGGMRIAMYADPTVSAGYDNISASLRGFTSTGSTGYGLQIYAEHGWPNVSFVSSTGAALGGAAQCHATSTSCTAIPLGPAALPGVPGNLTHVCSADATHATLSWSTVPNAASYDIRVDDQSNNGSSTGCIDGWYCAHPPDTLMNSYASTTLTVDVVPGHPYGWWMAAVNPAGGGRVVHGPAFTCTP